MRNVMRMASRAEEGTRYVKKDHHKKFSEGSADVPFVKFHTSLSIDPRNAPLLFFYRFHENSMASETASISVCVSTANWSEWLPLKPLQVDDNQNEGSITLERACFENKILVVMFADRSMRHFIRLCLVL